MTGSAERGGGCFMTCTKEGQALGHHLLIAHGVAILVSGLQQYGEEVIALYRIVAPLVDEALNAIAQDLYGFLRATIAWQRPTVWRREEHRGSMRNILHGDGHGSTQFVGFGEDVSVKERFADDAHGEVGHLPVDINAGTISPGLLNLLAVISHDINIADNMAWLKGRRHKLALVTVEIALATEDAITDYGPDQIMHCQAFVEVIGVFDQNAMDVLWFVEQDAGELPKIDAVNISFARHTL